MLHTKGQHMYIAGEVDVLTGEEIRYIIGRYSWDALHDIAV